MDIKINNTEQYGQYLEYNIIGGIIDLYFMAGPTPNEVARQYAQVAGLPAMMPYWGFGLHQCRWGYEDVYEVAEVVANYSAAGIPLETMWTDIDYMDMRQVFSLDPERFPLEKMRELVSTLHDRQQHYVMMVDPAVAYNDYPPFNQGVESNAFLKIANGSIYQGVVWPGMFCNTKSCKSHSDTITGVTAFPDWFASGTQNWWDDQFEFFFNADTGVDIDALWIDMNEASNFCVWPCTDAAAFAASHDYPPAPPPLRSSSGRHITGFPEDFQPTNTLSKRQSSGSMLGLPGRDLLNPPYAINNGGDRGGSLSSHTIPTNIYHENGLTMYDTHNLYGSMMSTASRHAMLARRPLKRPMVITRSTFAGAGARVGHWLGDNNADWRSYRVSIPGMLEFAALFQIPMVGSDVCGFSKNSWPELCARWATLGAFYPFYRNHAAEGTTNHEFYRWNLTTRAAKKAIDVRYRLLDYIYTAFHRQHQEGTPILQPMFFAYPNDTNTAPIQYQFFYGDSILVSPVTDDNSTSVTYYLPNDLFYDFFTYEPIRGHGTWVTQDNVGWTEIPVHIRGGSIIPLRQNSANTTTELRKQDFELLIAPGLDGNAKGELYLDEGEAIDQPETSLITFEYVNGELYMGGTFDFPTDVIIDNITVLGQKNASTLVRKRLVGGLTYDADKLALKKSVGVSLNGPYSTKVA